jgi:hypothetical protein
MLFLLLLGARAATTQWPEVAVLSVDPYIVTVNEFVRVSRLLAEAACCAVAAWRDRRRDRHQKTSVIP